MGVNGMGQSFDALASVLPGVRGESAPRNDRAALRRVAQEFEAIFIDELFKAGRGTTVAGGLFGKDRATKMYEEMHDEAMARSMAASGGLGIGRMLETELSRSLKP